MSLKTWLLPRFAFWVIWTVWLCCLRYSLLGSWSAAPAFEIHLLVVAPPMLLVTLAICWLRWRNALHKFDKPRRLFWASAAVSSLLAAFVNLCLMKADEVTCSTLVVVALICVYMVARGSGIKRNIVKHGDLFNQVQAIARLSGVSVSKVVLIKTPQNLPNAYASRGGVILLSERLLQVLSQRETEAVIAHEIAHLRPPQQMMRSVIPMLAGVTIVVRFFWPPFMNSAPFWPILTVFLWRAMRRLQEFDADANAIRITRDSEALITALTRITHIAGMPLHWGRIAGLFLSHPPMTARFRAIARTAGLSASRVDELISSAKIVPALPGFAIPITPPPLPESGLPFRNGLLSRIARPTRAFPLLAGVGVSAATLIFDRLPGLMFVGILLVILVTYGLLYKTITGRSK